jgi:hypothetical protein
VSDRRGLWLYAAAFALLLVAGGVLFVASRGFLNSIRLLWVSAGFSGAAIVASTLSVLLRRRG